jgi:hypothetical protein
MGTGALSMSDARRDMTAQVVGDRSSYMAFIPTSPYATIDNGQLALHFDEQTQGTDNAADGRSAEGLNQDSYNRFDDVFKIVNNTPQHETNGPMLVKIIDDHPRFQFNWGSGPHEGKETGAAGTVLENGDEVFVDLTINLLDHESMGDLVDDNPTFKIWAGEQ